MLAIHLNQIYNLKDKGRTKRGHLGCNIGVLQIHPWLDQERLLKTKNKALFQWFSQEDSKWEKQ